MTEPPLDTAFAFFAAPGPHILKTWAGFYRPAALSRDWDVLVPTDLVLESAGLRAEDAIRLGPTLLGGTKTAH